MMQVNQQQTTQQQEQMFTLMQQQQSQIFYEASRKTGFATVSSSIYCLFSFVHLLLIGF